MERDIVLDDRDVVTVVSLEEFFNVLMDSTLEAWRYHLSTDKYSAHMALDDFYKEIPELVDTLIEDYMGIYGKIDFIGTNILRAVEVPTHPIDFFVYLRSFIEFNKTVFFNDSELLSDIDAILSLIDSTLYKLKVLVE